VTDYPPQNSIHPSPFAQSPPAFPREDHSIHEPAMPLETIDDTEHGFDKEKRQSLGWFFWCCVVYFGLNVFVALFANQLHLTDPNMTAATNPNLPINGGPTAANWFGTDELGRDIFSRVMFGARVSLSIGFGAITMGFLIGGTLGVYAAFRRKQVDAVLSVGMYTILAFPAIIFLLAFTAIWKPISLGKIIILLGIASIPAVYRVIRGSTLAAGSREFVMAAKVQGASDLRIIFKEILPNILPTAISFYMIGVATLIILEGALAVLGTSVPPPAPSWGNMINEGIQYINAPNTGVGPWLVLFPGLAFCLLLLSINYIGDKLREHFDVTEGKL